jgi:hypothetical protein
MDKLPYEIFSIIIGLDINVYRGLLSVPCFARLLTIGKIFDNAVLFGYDARVENVSKCQSWNGLTTYKRAIVWFLNNSIHRVNGAAILYENGDEEWYYKGLRHRLNGPSILRKWEGGYYAEWYNKGMYHRIGGPAIESNYINIWCQNNQRHNEIGPAVIQKQFGEIFHVKWYIKDVWMKTESRAGIFVNYNSDNPWSLDSRKCPYYVY